MPTHRVTACTKDKNEDGKRSYHDVGAAWPLGNDGDLSVKLGGRYKAKTGEWEDYDDIYVVVVRGGEEIRLSSEEMFFNVSAIESSGGSKNKRRAKKGGAEGEDDFA